MEPGYAPAEAGSSTDDISFSSVLGNLVSGTDMLTTLRTVYKYRIFYDLQNGFVRIRCFQQGLCLAEDVLNFLERERASITDAEYNEWIRDFIELKLMMLDHLNLWEDYLRYFDRVVEEIPLIHKYTYTDLAQEQTRFGHFLMRSDTQYCYVHTLFWCRYRYGVIGRKYKRLLLGKTVGHLSRHQQDALTDDEIARRMGVTAQWVAAQASYRAKQLKEEAQREQETDGGAT